MNIVDSSLFSVKFANVVKGQKNVMQKVLIQVVLLIYENNNRLYSYMNQNAWKCELTVIIKVLS